ncbi:MAG TPA: glycoside hydrolase family 3 N-terminal domain-containing protein [Bacteroidales bacterium]|nr:glycoside hydrolase family 3 N-terminal domain-containing protein [Bacteroidales bacterium]
MQSNIVFQRNIPFLNSGRVLFLFILASIFSFAGCKKWAETDRGSFVIVKNKGGQTLGYSKQSGIKIITASGFAFKDLNRNGKLDPYEDWRLPAVERARDLASRMSVEQIAGLMLYSSHQAVPSRGRGFMGGTYNGKPFEESGADPADLSDAQNEFLSKDNVRHVLVTSVESPEVAARWNNNMQALTESLGLGIPVNISSDPRHGVIASAEYNAGAGGRISMWPEPLGLAATFHPEIIRQFGHIAALEYRALGITTALSPQIDLATDPRWSRVSGTFGESSKLAADLARAYIDGFQTSYDTNEIADGWGFASVNAMAKHWPGGGTGEGGRDAHFAYGKYAVYPGNNFAEHLVPFTEGAFKLVGKTGSVAAIMPYYTISYGQDTVYHENVGNSYSRFMISDLLRGKYNYQGVVCTDWGITADESPDIANMFLGGRCWGVEKGYTVAQRHYKLIMVGIDQFGGNNRSEPVIEAYKIGVKEHGESFMRKRFEESAVRLLLNMFRTGLFENPYLDPAQSAKIVGNPDFMKAGYEAQLKSVVLLKNKGQILPLRKGMKVFVPERYLPAGQDWFGNPVPERKEYPVNMDIVRKYFEVTGNPAEADAALVFVTNPETGRGYNSEDVKKGGNGYFPISLQYGQYTAVDARNPSIAGGDPLEKFTNRSYRGKTVLARNINDLKTINETSRKMKGRPVIVIVRMSNPMVFAEFEPQTAAILAHFGVQDQAILDIISGNAEPSGLLPMQMPANMKTVEKQNEDVPFDMECYTDSEGNTYDFGFGMNWKGVIKDERTNTYTRK